MTPNRRVDDNPEALWIIVQAIFADPSKIEGHRVRKAAQRFFGRPDALDLAREVLLEEEMLRELRAEIAIGSKQRSTTLTGAQPKPFLAVSLGSTAVAHRRARPWRNLGLAAAAAIVVGAALNWSAAFGRLRAIRSDVTAEPRTITTHAAQIDTVNLPDGSRAILAPNSTIEYSVATLAGPRELRLEGEALFDVKHDEERPFRVRTCRALVEDLGTSFVVREYASDTRTRVTVRSGAASLRSSRNERAPFVDLRPGDGAYVDSAGVIARFSGDPETFGAWSGGYIEFEAAPLPEVLSELATWYGVEFRTRYPTLAKQRFTGGLSSTSLSAALEVLGPIAHAHFAQEGLLVTVTARPEGR